MFIYLIIIGKWYETYNQGLYFIVCILADAGSFLIIAYIFAPRMQEFLGQLSVAEAMGNLYGNLVRVITAATGVIGTIGALALQFKVCESILSYCFSIPSICAVLLSGVVVIIYSTLGGIKAVTFTDIIQLFTFGTCVPILALIIWGTLDDPSSVITTITENPLLDYHQVFDPKTLRFWEALALFIYFLIPGVNPATFQRMTMARNVEQIRKSFVISAIILLIIELLISWIAILVLSKNPNLNSNNLVSYIIDNYSYVGLKGFIIAGIMAMIMSSVWRQLKLPKKTN